MQPCYFQCWRVLFLLLFLIHIVSRCHLSDVKHHHHSPVIWSIFLSSSLIHFTNGPDLFKRDVHSINVISVVEFGFEVPFSFLFFLSSPLVCWSPLSIFPSTCNFPFQRSFWFFPLLTVLFLQLFVFFLSSLWVWHIFLAKFHCLYPYLPTPPLG